MQSRAHNKRTAGATHWALRRNLLECFGWQGGARALLRLTFFFLSPAGALVVFFAGFFSAAVLVALGGAIAVGGGGVWGRRARGLVLFAQLCPRPEFELPKSKFFHAFDWPAPWLGVRSAHLRRSSAAPRQAATCER